MVGNHKFRQFSIIQWQLSLNGVNKVRQQVFTQIGSDMMSKCADGSMDRQMCVLLVYHSVILARDIKIKNGPGKGP